MFARPAPLVEPHLNLSHFIGLSFCCPQAVFFSRVIHSSHPRLQRVCSVSLTTDSANICSLPQEYIRIPQTGFEPSFFQCGARIGNLRGPGAGAAAGDFYTKLLIFTLIFTQLLNIILVLSAIRRHSSVPRFKGSTQTRTGVFFIFSTLTETRVRLLSTIYANRLERICRLVCLLVCLFVCLFRFVYFSVSSIFKSRGTEIRVLLSTIYMYLLFAAGTDQL